LKAKEKQKYHVEYAIFKKGYHRNPVFLSLSYFHGHENIEDDLAVKEVKDDVSMDHKICTHKLFPHTTTN